MNSYRSSVCLLALMLCASGTASADPAETGHRSTVLKSLRDFDKCEKAGGEAESEACLEALRIYVRSHPQDAFAAGKRVRHSHMHWVALEFFAQALAQPAPRKQCTDGDLRAAVLAGLGLPPHYPAVSLAQNIVTHACPKQLDADVRAEFHTGSGYYLDNACPTLAEKERPAACGRARDQAAPVGQAASVAKEPTKAELMAEAPRLREAPPARKEGAERVPTHRLDDVFPSVPAGQPISASERTLADLRGIDWKLLNVDSSSAEVLRGTHGEELLMARTKPSADYVLLKFKGITGPWNDRVLVAVERQGPAGKDYIVALDDREGVVMIERQRQYQAFPKGVKGGVWLNPVRPSEQAVKLPSRREIAREFAAADEP